MQANDMTCQELVELITEYLEAALPEGDRTRLEQHLAVCTGCRNYLEQMRHMIGTLGKLTEDAIPDGARDELLTLFRDWKRSEP